MDTRLYIAITDAFGTALAGPGEPSYWVAIERVAVEMADRLNEAYPLFDRAAFLRDCGFFTPAELDQRYREAEGYQEEQLPW